MLLGWFLFPQRHRRREARAADRTGGGARPHVMSCARRLILSPGTMRVVEVTALFQVGPAMRALPVEVGGRIHRDHRAGRGRTAGASARRELGRAASVMTADRGRATSVGANTPTDALVSRLPAKDRLLVVDDGVVVGGHRGERFGGGIGLGSFRPPASGLSGIRPTANRSPVTGNRRYSSWTLDVILVPFQMRDFRKTRRLGSFPPISAGRVPCNRVVSEDRAIWAHLADTSICHFDPLRTLPKGLVGARSATMPDS